MARKLFRLRPAVLGRRCAAGCRQRRRTAGRRQAANGGESAATPAARGTRRSIRSPPQNVKNLRIAWTWRGDNFGSALEIKNETTPIMVDGVLYFTAGDRRSVVAADAGTGETLWVWRLDEGARADGVRRNSRGVSYWTDGRAGRILTVTPGYQLVSLDAKTGQPDVATSEKTASSIMTKVVEKDANFNPAIGHLMNTSPPLIFGNIVDHPDVARERPRSRSR